MDRRRFFRNAGCGAAGLLLNSIAGEAQHSAAQQPLPVISQSAWGRVWIRWTEPTLPQRTLSAHGLVLPLDASPALLQSAVKQGYRVYFAAPFTQAAAAVESSRSAGVKGIILEAVDAEHDQAEKTATELRAAHPNLTVLCISPDAKQPAIMSNSVMARRNVIQVSSATQQPWLDSNVALVEYSRAFGNAQTSLLHFQWQLPDVLQKQLGPNTDSYLLAIAESGALHSDLLLNLHPSLQKQLISGNADGWATWKRIEKYVEFYAKEGARPVALQACVGVVTNDYDASYETMNLMARHNVPFRVLPPGTITSQNLQGLDLLVVFAQPDQAAIPQLAKFVDAGGIIIMVSLHNPFPGQTSSGKKLNSDSISYTMGIGKVIELTDGITDPGAFTRDIRRLLGTQNISLSLWNAATTIATPYMMPDASTATVELVNYSADPMPVQVRIKGSYSIVQYESPEHGCCEVLKASHQDGFTQFEVPSLGIGGRVHLSGFATPQRQRA